MKYFYEGNLNLAENRREQNGQEYYIRGACKFGDRYFERYAIKTPFIGKDCDVAEAVKTHVLPVYREGDILAVTEKVVSLWEGRVLDYENRKPRKLAVFLSRFMTRTALDLDLELKMEAFIETSGTAIVLLGVACGVVGKLLGKDGWMYRILGREAAGMDGLYTGSHVGYYRKHAILIPKEAETRMQMIEDCTGCPCFVSDTNDATVNLYAFSEKAAAWDPALLQTVMADNPGGQDDEMTPFILIREVSEAEISPCAVPKEISREEFLKLSDKENH